MKYYSTQRPVSLGTYPKPSDNRVTNIRNYADRTYNPAIKKWAWGEIEYAFPLSPEYVDAYELTPDPNEMNDAEDEEEEETEKNEFSQELEDLDWMFDRLCFMDLTAVSEEADDLRGNICILIDDLARMILKKKFEQTQNRKEQIK